MDIVNIEPKMLKGTVTVPPSKSVAHRAIISAGLSGEKCRISNVNFSEDIKATIECMKALGASVKVDERGNSVTFTGKKKIENNLILDCNESGSTLRFLIPIALLSGQKVTFKGRGRLMERPFTPYKKIFDEKGIKVTQKASEITLQGKLKSGKFSVAGDVSSQFITGLLFALPLLDGDSEIVVTTDLESKGYIDITLKVLSDFGIEIINKNYKKFIVKGNQNYRASDYEIEGDFSQGAFFLVAGALGNDIECKGLSLDSVQGDKEIIDIIKKTGAEVVIKEGSISAKATGKMKGITVDARNIPDLVPIISVLMAFCDGESEIINAGRLRMKESDRLSAVASELKYLGVDITEGVDYLKIKGTDVLVGKTVSSWNDHRIAMALAIAATRCEGDVAITDANKAVKKSYPDFFEVYKSISKGPEVLFKNGDIVEVDR